MYIDIYINPLIYIIIWSHPTKDLHTFDLLYYAFVSEKLNLKRRNGAEGEARLREVRVIGRRVAEGVKALEENLVKIYHEICTVYIYFGHGPVKNTIKTILQTKSIHLTPPHTPLLLTLLPT